MLTLKKGSIKYKDENGNMVDAGAVVGAEVTDSSLTKSGIPADAKTVGDKLDESKTYTDNQFTEAKTYADTVASQKCQVQIVTWEADD